MTNARPAALLAALAAATLACSGGSTSSPETPRAEVVVAVDPGEVQIAPGGSVAFAATVTGAADTAVTWSVQETTGGTIDASGRYVAPQAEGSYHVVARSVVDPAAAATATVTVSAAAPPVAVTITPGTTSVAAGGAVTFTAIVAGTADTRVTWSVREASGCGSVTQTGQYTAPAAAATCHVVATSTAVPAATQTATVTVTSPPPVGAVALTVTPSRAAVSSCQSVTFSASVTGTPNTAVTWAVQEATGGTITPAGVYTAPANAGTYHVVGTSQADPSRIQVAEVIVADRILSVQVAPASVTLAPGQSGQFTATVTTTCGTYTSTSTVTAPATAAN